MDIPYEIFDPITKNKQAVFHFVLKKISPWKESYIKICLSTYLYSFELILKRI